MKPSRPIYLIIFGVCLNLIVFTAGSALVFSVSPDTSTTDTASPTNTAPPADPVSAPAPSVDTVHSDAPLPLPLPVPPPAAGKASVVTKDLPDQSILPSENQKKTEVLSAVNRNMQRIVSVDFSETPIEDVLRILADQANVDIVKSPKVTGTVTASLTDVPLSEALDNILAAHGFGYVTTETIIRVVPREEILDTREKVLNRVYRLNYANVRDVEKALQKFVTKDGSVSVNPGTSNVIVSDIESKVLAIDSFINEINRVTPQILVEAKIYDITTTDNFDLGVEWQAGRNSLLSDTVGTNPTGTENNDPFIKSTFGGTTGYTKANGQLRIGIFNSNLDIDAQIKMLHEDITAKLLASPSIMGLDNEPAEFKIVSQIPYQELTETSAGGSIGTTAFRDVGVELKVTPHVTEEASPGKPGMIRLQIQPKFSVATSEVQVGGVSVKNPQPVVDSREANIATLLRDGQTMVIAGLRKKEAKQRYTKVPILGDIPLVGLLFQSHAEETINSQLFVFITARIIYNQELPPTTNAQKLAAEELNMKDIPPTRPQLKDRTAKK